MTVEVGGITFDAYGPKALAKVWLEATAVPVGSTSNEFCVSEKE